MVESSPWPPARPALGWGAALGFATVAGTVVISCMMPFVALALILAATMPPRRGGETMLAIWMGNQLLGFALLGFPATAYTFAWGGALLAASLAAMAVVQLVVGGRELVAARLAVGFAAAFLTYEGLLFLFASLVGGLETFTLPIVARIALNDTLWFLFLLGLHVVLTRSAPGWFGAPARLRFVS
jgi:hypothetical protein